MKPPTLVYLDGWVLPTDLRKLSFDGFHASHKPVGIPQLSGVKDRPGLDRTIGSRDYWEARRIDPE